jgi:tRNA dimethylallyltransferase
MILSHQPSPLLIAGPTASGKSAYALLRAREQPSLIINADSMQVYADLRILTARPANDELAQAPHALYGTVPGSEAYSTGRYVRDVIDVLAHAKDRGLRPIIVGGTGLYFKALLEGLSPIPEVPREVRERWREAERREGSLVLHARLAQEDPVMASRLQPGDSQRIVRAFEILDATGRSLAEWQAVPGTPVLQAECCERVVMSPLRSDVYARADARFESMLDLGALDEVRALLALGYAQDLPIMRAVGVPQLASVLTKDSDLSDALREAKMETRHYIKRQQTWLRRNMNAWRWQAEQ